MTEQFVPEKEMAVTITASEARRVLLALIERVNDDRAPSARYR